MVYVRVIFNKMKSFQKEIFFLILLLFFLFIFSCSKNERSNNLVSPEIEIESESSDKATLVFGEGREKTVPNQDSSTDNKGFTEIEKGDIKGQLFSIDSKKIIPEDMVIGSLLKYKPNNISSGSFPSSIITFFSDTVKGSINQDVLHPLWSENIQKLFSNRLSEQYFTIRIGDIVDKDGIKTANIRLIGKTGRVSGSVSADNLEGKWLLSDISIDFIYLEDIYLRENLEFNPLSYSNIMLNY